MGIRRGAGTPPKLTGERFPPLPARWDCTLSEKNLERGERR